MSAFLLRHGVTEPRTVEPQTTVLGIAATSLAAGQCVRLNTTITAADILDEGAPIFKWGSSGVWVPSQKEMMIVCKRQDAGHAYKCLVYDEVNNTLNYSRTSPEPANISGHAYDHNALNPFTNRFVTRLFNDDSGPYEWTGSVWTQLPAFGVAIDDASSLTGFPGVGLLVVDYQRILLYNGTSWSTAVTLGGASGNHGISEHNPNSNVMVLGGGNAGTAMSQMTSGLVVTSIPTPSFNVGSSEGQGLCVADPAGLGFIINQKETDSWQYWEPGDVSWTNLTQSTGDGSAPQTGLPNLVLGAADAGRARIAIPINTYGVIMFVEYVGGADVGRIWIYKHT